MTEFSIYSEIILALCMLVVIIGVICERIKSKRGIGIRIIQFLAAGLLIPLIGILGVRKVLPSESIATLFGAIAGYILANIGKEEEK